MRRGKGTLRVRNDDSVFRESGTSTRPMTTKSQRRSNIKSSEKKTSSTIDEVKSPVKKSKKKKKQLLLKVNNYIRRSYQST